MAYKRSVSVVVDNGLSYNVRDALRDLGHDADVIPIKACMYYDVSADCYRIDMDTNIHSLTKVIVKEMVRPDGRTAIVVPCGALFFFNNDKFLAQFKL